MDGASDGTSSIGVRDQEGLVKLVGYTEIMKAAGVSRSSIERAWRRVSKDGTPLPDDGEPRLPPPGKIGTRAVWTLSDANAWIRARAGWQSQSMNAMARVSVDDLAPEQLEEQALDLAAQAFSKRSGMPIDKAELSQILTLVADERDLLVLEREAHENRAAHLSALPVNAAVKLAAALLPQLRPVLRSAVNGIAIEDGTLVPAAALDLFSFLIQADRNARHSLEHVPDSFGELSNRLDVYGLERALILSAWFFPALRSIMVKSSSFTDAQLFTDEAMLKKFAWAAIDDERWIPFASQLIARGRPQANGGGTSGSN